MRTSGSLGCLENTQGPENCSWLLGINSVGEGETVGQVGVFKVMEVRFSLQPDTRHGNPQRPQTQTDRTSELKQKTQNSSSRIFM